MKNYFDHQDAAKRYKVGRPNFHPLIVDKIRTKLNIRKKLNTSLDVACGTGLLTVALLEISDSVIGVDTSAEMLSQAEQRPAIKYFVDKAEELNGINVEVDLITVTSAFHWFDQSRFLKSSYQKLKEGGCLVIHNNSFTGRTDDQESDNLLNWMLHSYLKQFESPSRNQKTVEKSQILSIGFEVLASEKFENTVSFNKERLIEYLITHSNIIRHVDHGTGSIEEVKEWLFKELASFFVEKGSRNFVFKNQLIFLKK